MPKKSNVKPLKAAKMHEPHHVEVEEDVDDVPSGLLADVMGEMIQHTADTSRTEQATALELTKLALAHTKNADAEVVFELFRRSAIEVNELYGSSIIEQML